MKHIALTEDEIRTLLWAVQCMTAEATIKALKNGKNPSESDTIQRLNAIGKKAYTALTAGKDLTK